MQQTDQGFLCSIAMDWFIIILGLWVSAADKKAIFARDGISKQTHDRKQWGCEIMHLPGL